MGRGLGRALQSVLAQEGPGEDLEVEGPSLANARRRQLFRYLCLRPCARVGEIGRVLGMSHATVRWHERDLLESGYIESDGTRAFPRGLIDPVDAALFGLLAAPGRSAVLLACYGEPGISLLELATAVGLSRQSASKITSELSDLGLVTLVEDGRFRRHYPTDLLGHKRTANRPRAKAFAEAFLRRLADERLSPELLRSEDSGLVVRFGSTTQRIVLDVPLDPYVTAWKSER
ncbi:MAG TPA: MarR family transcriptional regulator [Thermoplasmata archaeon]|nr:MarR family transcriptional regulator [Thermoplasmata archaeon]